jgi:hypothetical protein
MEPRVETGRNIFRLVSFVISEIVLSLIGLTEIDDLYPASAERAIGAARRPATARGAESVPVTGQAIEKVENGDGRLFRQVGMNDVLAPLSCR